MSRAIGSSHSRCHLTDWSEQNMAIALGECDILVTAHRKESMPMAKVRGGYGIPGATFWKCVMGVILGVGHRSGGRGKF